MKHVQWLRTATAWLGVGLGGFVVATHAQSPAPQGPHGRAEATSIIEGMRRIVADEGVERLEAVRIGGIDQWVSIRGNDRGNPVLLMLHGGPGWVSMPTSWYFQRGWEEYFTVVQWDQRGAGKTFAANDAAALAPTMTMERMVADAEELVMWLRKEFDQERIFVLGHSWGSVLGMELARRRPAWLHAYVGMGQLVNGPESERRGWQWTLERARTAGNEEAVAELLSLAPYAQGDGPVPLEDLMVQRRWLNHYGGMVHNRDGGSHEVAAIALSPEYTDEDVRSVGKGSEFSMHHLLGDVLSVDFDTVRRLDVPVALFLGRHDVNVNSELAAQWLDRLQAPHKQLVWFEHSAHEVMNEEPGKVLVSLVRHVLPLGSNSDRPQCPQSAAPASRAPAGPQ